MAVGTGRAARSLAAAAPLTHAPLVSAELKLKPRKGASEEEVEEEEPPLEASEPPSEPPPEPPEPPGGDGG